MKEEVRCKIKARVFLNNTDYVDSEKLSMEDTSKGPVMIIFYESKKSIKKLKDRLKKGLRLILKGEMEREYEVVLDEEGVIELGEVFTALGDEVLERLNKEKEKKK